MTVRDTDQAVTVLDAAIAAGANQVYGVTFTVWDDQAWETGTMKVVYTIDRRLSGKHSLVVDY